MRAFRIPSAVAIAVIGIATLCAKAEARPTAHKKAAELSRLLKSHDAFKVRTLAAVKLGELHRELPNDPSIVSSLQAALRDPHHLVRGASVRALAAHRADSALAALRTLRDRDADAVVRRDARAAIEEIRKGLRDQAQQVAQQKAIKRSTPGRRVTVEVGRVDIADARGWSRADRDRLAQALRDSIEDQIEPHKPAIFPRERPDYRFDITVERNVTPTRAAGQDVSFKVKLVLVEMPSANLRHVTSAVARSKLGKKSKSGSEERVALKATTRAVGDALGLLYGSAAVLANRF